MTDSGREVAKTYDELQAELAAFAAHSAVFAAIRAAILPHTQEVYLVGGAIRDLALGREFFDLDFAHDLLPEQLRSVCLAAGYSVYDTGLQHGTVTVLIEGRNIEFTTFRSLAESSEFGSNIDEDLAGRDYTVNALAYNIDSEALHDPCNGLDDLLQNKLRAVGSQADLILQADPLRLLRAVRLSATYGLEIEEQTWEACLHHQSLLHDVSIERVREEFSKIVTAPGGQIRAAFEKLRRLGFYDLYIPEIIDSIGFEQNQYHTEDVYNHTLSVMENAPAELALRLAAFFHDFGKPGTLSVDEANNRHFYKHELLSAELCQSVMQRFKYSKKLTSQVTQLVAYHMRPLDCGPSAVRRLMRDLGDNLDPWLILKTADTTAIHDAEDLSRALGGFRSILAEEVAKASLPIYGKLAIDGHQLMALGIPEGKEVGRVLRLLEDLVLERPAFNRTQVLIALAKQYISRTNAEI